MESQISPSNEVGPGTRGPLPGRSVLVVEDVRSTADILGLYFETNGHAVRVTYTGEDAVVEAQLSIPDLILMDLGLPEMNGPEAVRQIRSLPNGHHPRIIAVSGFDDEALTNKSGKDGGFDAHLSKPVDPNELEALVARLLSEF